MHQESNDLASQLTRLAASVPDYLAVITPEDEEHDFAAMDRMAEAVRTQLPERPGRRVGIRLSNDPASVAAVQAVWSRGHAMVALSHALPQSEVEQRLEQVGASVLVDPHSDCPDVSHLRDGRPRDEDEAVVMFTSGTTGQPKAASLRSAAILGSCRTIAEGSGVPASGRPPTSPPRAPRPIFTPLAHMAGTLSIVTGWYLGAPILLCDRFSADLVLDLVRRHRLTSLSLTPAMVYDLAYHPDKAAELPNVRAIVSGTAPLPEPTRRRFEERYGIPVLRNYGQTEFAGAIAFERYEDVVTGNRPAGSVGRIAPGVEVSVRDEKGRPLREGEVGEIWARARSQMSGYLDEEGEPDSDADDGFIATGDLGHLHEGDMLTVVGRVKDLIICGGFNVYPAQVERLLDELPGVAESVVAGLPDARLGEVPVAVVVPVDPANPPDPEDLDRRLREVLPPYEVPRRIAVIDEIARTHNGKPDRAAVADVFQDGDDE